MFRSTTRMLVAAVFPLAMGVMAPVTHAEDAYPARAPQQAESRTQEQLSEAGLGRLLASMGYEVEPDHYDNGRTYYVIRTRRDGLNIVIRVFLSQDGKRVFLGSPLSKPVDVADPVAAAHLLGLLEKNADLMPAYFAYNREDRYMWLLMPVENGNLDARAMRNLIDKQCQTLAETFSLWDSASWTAPAKSAQTQSPAPSPSRFGVRDNYRYYGQR